MIESKDAGFTLVELLIAIALLGMLTVLAYGAVEFGNLAWHNASNRRDADADRAAIRQLLEQSIRTAYPAYASTEYADRRIAFDGKAASLQLIAPLPEALTPGLMAVERFDISPANGEPVLRMSWHLDLPKATGGPLPSKVVRVAAFVSRIRFAYFGRLRDDQPSAWFDHWSGMEHLPDLVHVTVWREGRPEAPWLEFSTATETTTNTACVYDPESPICRRLE